MYIIAMLRGLDSDPLFPIDVLALAPVFSVEVLPTFGWLVLSVILYASIKTLDRQLLDLMANTDIDAAITAAKDAITKSGQYLDGSGATTTNVVAWLNDEDSASLCLD